MITIHQQVRENNMMSNAISPSNQFETKMSLVTSNPSHQVQYLWFCLLSNNVFVPLSFKAKQLRPCSIPNQSWGSSCPGLFRVWRFPSFSFHLTHSTKRAMVGIGKHHLRQILRNFMRDWSFYMDTFFGEIEAELTISYVQFSKETLKFRKILEMFPSMHDFRVISRSCQLWVTWPKNTNKTFRTKQRV